MTDPIADMLSRVRNATQGRHPRVDVPASRLKVEIARILESEGYIQGFKVVEPKPGETVQATLRLFLKYGPRGERLRAPPRHEEPGLGKFHGLARRLVANAVRGVTEGFRKDLDIVGVGYRAEVKGKQVVFALGYSHPVVFDIPTGIDIAIDKQTHVTVTGIDRQLVGQVAADIRQLRKPDPYKQKGVRYTGEVLKKKAGKTGAK